MEQARETVREVPRREVSVGAPDETQSRLELGAAVFLSLLIHLAIVAGLALIDVAALAIAPPPTPTEFIIDTTVDEPEVEEPEPAAEEPEPAVEEPEPAAEEPEPEPIQRAEANEPAPEPPPPAEEPPPPEPLDLSGTVLTGAGDSSFSVVQGDGSDREGPIGPPPRRRSGSPDGVPGGTGGGGMGSGTGPRVVPVADLSRRPAPPDQTEIARCLQEGYPRAARNQGLEGVSRVRGRVMPDGSFGRLRIASESIDGQGFGQACLRCLRGERWTPPLGPNGSPVATDVTYTCNFRIR